jgi:hypothetical protein
MAIDHLCFCRTRQYRQERILSPKPQDQQVLEQALGNAHKVLQEDARG